MQRFKEIFEGNNSAYGIMKLTGEVTEKGKAVARALIKRENVIDQLWSDHIEGKEPALGVIPINENNMCKCCLLYTSPSPRDLSTSRMPSSA